MTNFWLMIETLGHIFKHILKSSLDSAEHGVKLSYDLLAAAHSVKHDQ